MAWRGTGALLALGLIGCGGGFAVAAATSGAPEGSEPLPSWRRVPPTRRPSRSPSSPTPTSRRCCPASSLRRVPLGDPPYDVSALVPRGWIRNDTGVLRRVELGASGAPLNSYVLRVKLVGNLRATVPSALAERMARLEAAAAIQRFNLESQGPDSFVATYVQVDPENDPFAGYTRLTMERFLTLPGQRLRPGRDRRHRAARGPARPGRPAPAGVRQRRPLTRPRVS